MLRKCDYCGSTYAPRARAIAKGIGRNCSRACAARGRRPKRAVQRISDPISTPGGEVRHIQLNKGQIAVIDAADFDLVCEFTWSVAGSGYVRTEVDGQSFSLHRLILKAPADQFVDHINGDVLDNRRANLRPATRSQNMQNQRGAQRNSASGRRGVIRRHYGAYQVRLGVAGKTLYLGTFSDLEQADAVARAARARLMPYSPEAREEAARVDRFPGLTEEQEAVILATLRGLPEPAGAQENRADVA
jgi:hypothetical protein